MMVADLAPGQIGRNPQDQAVVATTLYFTADDGLQARRYGRSSLVSGEACGGSHSRLFAP
jgi:hypothetical protein